MAGIPTTSGAVYVQPNGAGNALKFVVGQNTGGQVGAYSGGGTSVESVFTFGRAVGTRITGNPARYTFNIMARREVTSALRDLAKSVNCIPNVLIFAGCTPQDVDNFSLLTVFVDAAVVGDSPSGNLIEGITGENADMMDQIDFDALAKVECKPLSHADLSGTVSTGAFNDVLLLSGPSCPDACGPGSDGASEFLAVGDPVAPATIPRIFYTDDGGNTWTQQTIAAAANAAATAVAVAGTRVIVTCSGTDGGVYTASLKDVKAGTATFTEATTVPTANYNDVIALDPATVLVVGASGAIYISRDGGYSFEALSSGVAAALNSVSAGDDKSAVWVGGAAGTLLRIKNLRTVETIADPTSGADVTVVKVPRDRSGEVYVGTDEGGIWVSKNAQQPIPTWTALAFDQSGVGVINDIDFAEARQSIMFVVQTDAGGDSRVLVDYSGGKMGKWAIAVGTFASPVNAGINAIAAASANFALTVGEPETGQGFIGAVSGA